MKNFIYNIRRFFLHSKRRHRPGVRNFWLNLRKDTVFRTITIAIFLIAALIVIFVLLITVLPDNAVKAFVKKDSIKVIDSTPTNDTSNSSGLTAVPTPVISPTATITLEPTYTPDPNASPTPLPVDENTDTISGYIVAPSGLVVRTGPTKQHAKLGTLPYGTKVEIIKEGVWHFIVYNDGGAYVHSNYVEITQSPPGASTKQNSSSQTWTSINNSTKILVEKFFYNGAIIYVADIKTEAKNFLTAYDILKKKPSELAVQNNATLAINGDYFGYRDDGIIIRNGELLRDEPSQEMAVLYENGRIDVYFSEEKNAEQMLKDGALQVWSFGPILVKDFKAYESFAGRSRLNPPNPRTAIGMVKPNHYIIIVVDGRQENSKGLTLIEFAELFAYYECETAYNLDGGGTSVMIFNDEIISSPSGETERNCTDIIYFK